MKERNEPLPKIGRAFYYYWRVKFVTSTLTYPKPSLSLLGAPTPAYARGVYLTQLNARLEAVLRSSAQGGRYLCCNTGSIVSRHGMNSAISALASGLIGSRWRVSWSH